MASSSSMSTDSSFTMNNLLHMMTIKLSSSNYLLWRNNILPIFTYQKLLPHLNGTIAAPPATITVDEKEVPNPAAVEWAESDQKAVIFLQSSLTEEAAAEVLGLSTARDIWVALENAYSNASVERIHSLRDSLRQLTKGTSSVSDFSRRFKALCDQLSAIGHPVVEIDRLHWFLCGLGPSYETFSTAIRATKPAPLFRDLVSQAESHELFLQCLHGSSTPPAAFQAENRTNRNSSQSRGHNTILSVNTYAGVELEDHDIFNHTIEILLDHREIGNQLKPSIYMVRGVLRDLSPVSFNPRVVSIGPLHKDDENLQEYEGKKVTYLQCLLRRLVDTPTDQTLKTCLFKVKASIGKIRACYSGMKPYTDVELLIMMVTDGCFILELILRYSDSKDPIWRNFVLTQYLIYDMVILENQIPFFVLTDLFECTVLKFKPEASLMSLILLVLNSVNLFKQDLNLDNIAENTTHDHILGVLQKCYEPTQVIAIRSAWFKNRTAIELERAGVDFKPKRNSNWPLAIEIELSKFPRISWFWGKPTLKMPVLYVDDYTELVLRNLIAYEQCSEVPSYISSYAVFMDIIVDNEDDVATLVEWDVFDNSLGSNEEAADMINKICKEVAIVDSFSYCQQLEQLDQYCKGYWPKNIARLRRKYFTSPWNFIALLAAIILFALTFVQTIFSIKPRP